MAVELQSENGTKFPLPPRYWSFFLTLAQTCEWQPKGSSKPKHALHEDYAICRSKR